MSTLGTRTFWLSTDGSTDAADAPQILMHSGYVSVILDAVHFRPQDDFWQRGLGGSHRIAVTSTIRYRYGGGTVEATTLQNTSTVKAKHLHLLNESQILALKVPTDADALEFGVSISTVRQDNLERAFELLNSADFKTPLELAPPLLGPVLTVTALVKRMITQSGAQSALQASYPGILSKEAVANPVKLARLVEGYIVMVANQDGADDSLNTFSPETLRYSDRGLRHQQKPLPYTYVVFSISADALRGANAHAGWYLKYQQALRELDRLHLARSRDHRRLYNLALTAWVEGSALLDVDDTYLQTERAALKMTALADLKQKYQQITGGESDDHDFSIDVMELADDDPGEGEPRDLRPIMDLPRYKLMEAGQGYRARLHAAGLDLDWKS